MPKLDQGHPYEYGFVRRWNSPMWWRIPSDQEISAMEVQRVAREAERLATKEPPTEAPIRRSPSRAPRRRSCRSPIQCSRT
ncbi:hypothetical protein [Nannocystis pusilla]|uniref:hypothetical protein n=1 Tax=Nannocystis pusilla TaxID=889268 RepID=UPI003B7741B2